MGELPNGWDHRYLARLPKKTHHQDRCRPSHPVAATVISHAHLIPTEGFWLGRLSAHIGEAINPDRNPKAVRAELKAALAEFIASPVPSEELRVILRRYL
jgi:hypothetical protein